jgi:hypothetical protein
MSSWTDSTASAIESDPFHNGRYLNPLQPKLLWKYSSPQPSPGHREDPDQLYTMKCMELLYTEESYLSSLCIVTNVFMAQIERRNVVQARDFRLLFPAQLEQLVDIHSTLLHHLTSQLNLGKYNTLGSVFVQLLSAPEVSLSGVYAAYMNSFQVSCQTQQKYAYDSYFQQVYQDCLSNPCCKGLDLFAHLLTPVQRLPRYRLILLELMALSSTLDPQLQAALDLLEVELTTLNSAFAQVAKFSMWTPEVNKTRRIRRRNYNTIHSK